MTNEEANKMLVERAKEILKIPEIMDEYQSKESKEAAEDWVLKQALITLMYSHEERIKMFEKKREMTKKQNK